MNKKIIEKVKAQCKDMGLSEKWLNETTEALGGHVADDSTEDEEIDKVVNLVVAVAKSSQAEATRWAQKKKDPEPKPKQEPEPEPKPDPDPNEPAWFKAYREQQENRLKSLEEKGAAAEAERQKAERNKTIQAAFNKHNIPEEHRQYLIVPDSVEDVDAYVGGMKKVFVTSELPLNEGEKKVAVDKAAEQTGKSWFSKFTGSKQAEEK